MILLVVDAVLNLKPKKQQQQQQQQQLIMGRYSRLIEAY